MGLELVIFIAAALFGIFLYWRESNGNRLYRLINKIVNSKKLQMKSEDNKGFVYKQTFLPRLVFIVGLFLLAGVVVQFLTPFKIFTTYDGISAFSSVIVGTLLGTYIANFVLKSGEVIGDKSDSLEDIVSNTIEKGKDFIEEIKKKDETDTQDVVEEVKEVEEPEKEEKSARQRLKDKGLM